MITRRSLMQLIGSSLALFGLGTAKANIDNQQPEDANNEPPPEGIPTVKFKNGGVANSDELMYGINFEADERGICQRQRWVLVDRKDAIEGGFGHKKLYWGKMLYKECLYYGHEIFSFTGRLDEHTASHSDFKHNKLITFHTASPELQNWFKKNVNIKE